MIRRFADHTRQFIASFAPRNVPLMTRQSYAHELTAAWSFTIAVALIEGEFIAILVRKAFNATAFQVAVIAAAPLFANLVSLMWARLSRGRAKVPFTVAVMVALLALVGAIGALGTSTKGTWWLIAMLVVARCLMAGMVTVRSTIWRHNYPRQSRARLTGRLSIIAGIVMIVVTLVGARLLDINQESFRVFFPVAALVGLIGAIAMWRVRVRGERALLQYENQPDARPERHGEGAGIYEYDDHAPTSGFWAVLKHDRDFRDYMKWMFLSGTGNMMLIPVIILFVDDATRGRPHAFLVSNALIKAMPFAIAMATVPLWTRFLDRLHIARFRAHQSWVWIVGMIFMFAGAQLGPPGVLAGLLVFAVGRGVMGFGQGGGMLAWNLGHNDFASRQMVAVYMGIHVTLTGVRGVIAPFIGTVLYRGWPAFSVPGLGNMPEFNGIGPYVFLVGMALTITANRCFYRLSRRLSAAGRLNSSDG